MTYVTTSGISAAIASSILFAASGGLYAMSGRSYNDRKDGENERDEYARRRRAGFLDSIRHVRENWES